MITKIVSMLSGKKPADKPQLAGHAAHDHDDDEDTTSPTGGCGCGHRH